MEKIAHLLPNLYVSTDQTNIIPDVTLSLMDKVVYITQGFLDE